MRHVTDNRRRCALNIHVLKTKSVIGELRVPIGRFGLLLRRVVVLRSDAPGSGDVPASQVGRGKWTLGLSIAHASGRRSVHPPAILPLLWIYSGWSWWHEGVVRNGMGDNRSVAIWGGMDDGGRGPG
jgi:hypothetical protein